MHHEIVSPDRVPEDIILGYWAGGCCSITNAVFDVAFSQVCNYTGDPVSGSYAIKKLSSSRSDSGSSTLDGCDCQFGVMVSVFSDPFKEGALPVLDDVGDSGKT